MEMTYQNQDNLLLNDILIRNYYNNFNELKDINLTFFYNNNYTNKNYIPNYENLELKNNLELILKHWELFLKWYEYQKFNTIINIHDDILFNNLTWLNNILELFFKKNINYKQLILHINYEQQKKIEELFSLLNNYKNKLYSIFNININNITKEKLKLLNEYGQINIIIPPGLTGEELINFQKIINNSGVVINQYIEQDTKFWDNKNIKEYLKYINFLLDTNLKNNNLNLLFSTNLPIGLIDQHNIDNLNCKKNCCFQKSFNILLIDFSINLCHKFQYDDQIIGYLKPNEKEDIFTVESKILPLVMLNTHLKRTSTPHCEDCVFINICKGFCFFESYKICFNPIIPIKETCNLKKSKYIFIFHYLKIKYNNLIEQINNIDNLNKIYKNYLILLINKIK